MDEHEPLIERLRRLGRDEIEPGVVSRHLGAMAGMPVSRYRFAKLKVGTAFFAGLMLGGTGLAYAGALPATVQDAAHGALSQVGLSVPNGHGPARYNGPECTGGPYANHGQYVRSHHSDPNAGRSRCGKPVQAGTNAGGDGTETPETPDTEQGNNPGIGHGRGHHGNNGNNGNSADNGTPNATPAAPPMTAPTPPPTTLPTPTTSTTTATTTTTTTTTSVPTPSAPTTSLG